MVSSFSEDKDNKDATTSIKRILQEFERASDQKQAWAQYNLGVCYNKGVGVQQDYKTSASFFRIAARQKHLMAHFKLGICYEYGLGESLNKMKALRRYNIAADNGLAYAQFFLAKRYEKGETAIVKDESKAVKLYRLAAEQNYPGAKEELERCEKAGMKEKSSCAIM